MHPKLSHLSNEQVSELMKMYYDGGEKVAGLISEYELDLLPSQLVGTFSPFIHDDLLCQYCNTQNLVSKRLSRDHGSWGIGNPFCPLCNHSEEKYCRCKNCLKRKRYSNHT